MDNNYVDYAEIISTEKAVTLMKMLFERRLNLYDELSAKYPEWVNVTKRDKYDNILNCNICNKLK